MREVGEVAANHQIELAIAIEVRDGCAGRSVNRKEELLPKLVMSIICQDANAVVGFQNSGVVEVVAVDVNDVRFAVAVEIVKREIHRTVNRREARKNLLVPPKTAVTIVFKHYDSLVTLRK